MKTWLSLIAIVLSFGLEAQTIIFDEHHFMAVTENAAMRNLSEMGYHQSLEGIRQNTDDIGIQLSSLTLVQVMIHRSLTEVNEALKDAIQVKQLGRTIQQIFSISEQAIDIASTDPMLLLFAEEYIRQAKERSIALITDISGFVLAEGSDVFINHNVRDELISNIRTELQLIHASMLAVKNSMYWAKMNGVLRKLNPYQAYLNRDIYLINQILQQKKTLAR
ncbi:hypothetical protein P872_06120 [Rhodonellum psychrophilum GCM71 = DSM 17998]|uniref:Plasmid transfer protein n=2 Tax=Rhodonellum TaxID=336827 RepID=U5C4B9_9BACT|nr:MULTISPECIES: hypothetical protein [Rhodonellum]ERM83047.1 hypothetical protein P872_06120 [Rhodonellum psychrophilum GCM71 = DSM 17998]SDZ47396.1 hypothetical protein SAMN05444412_11647 [Rhodonellum ikkaensis]